MVAQVLRLPAPAAGGDATSGHGASALPGARYLVLAAGQVAAEGATDAIGELAADLDLDPAALAGIRVLVIDGQRAVSFDVPAAASGPDA
jgi:hypothetical protein